MSLSEPVIGGTLSPQWAMLLNADLTVIDGHNHTPGSGVPIPSGGLNINADLTFNGNNLLDLNSLVFDGAATGLLSDLSLSSNGTDLFYKDINGVSIQLTKNGQPNTSTGNIQGLPSTPIGSAGITWVNAQSAFRFLMDSGAAGANIEAGSYVMRYPGSYPTPTGNFIILEAPSTLATGFSLVLPAALPASQAMLSFSNSGTGAFVTPDGTTIAISANVLSVPTGGIGTTQLATSAVTPIKLGAQTTGQSSSTTVTNTTGTYANIASTTMVLTGQRAVMISGGGNSASNIIITASGSGVCSGEVALFLDASNIEEYSFSFQAANGGDTFAFPAGAFSFLDSSSHPSGTHTYFIRMRTGSNCSSIISNNFRVDAAEL